jgi:hypothetical protein
MAHKRLWSFFFSHGTNFDITQLPRHVGNLVLSQTEDSDTNFQQGNTLFHCVIAFTTFFRQVQWERRLEPWPSSSPYLTPIDFYLRGYIKYVVYSGSINNLKYWKQQIRDAVETLTTNVAQVARIGVLIRCVQSSK